MRGSLVNRGKNRWALVLDLGYVVDLATGKRRRKQKWISFDGTKKQAGDKLTEHVRAANRGEFVEPSKTTTGEWLNEWLEKVIAPTKRRRTVATYRCHVDNALVPKLGTIPLQQLKTADMQHYIAEAIKDGFGPATIRLHLAILSGALKAALLDNLIIRNVVSLAQDKPRVPSPQNRVKANTWGRDDARTFLAEAAKHGPMVHAFYATALSTGARQSELAGLQWDHVNFDKGFVTIMQELDLPDDDGAVSFGPTKTDTVRVINVGGDVITLLREHRRHQAELKLKNRPRYEDHNLVFCREHEYITLKTHALGQPVYVDGYGPGRLEVLAKLADVKRISAHGLRDTGASLLAQNGVPLKVISERLGHARGEMTLSRYIAVLPGMQESAGAALNALLHG